MGLAFDRRIVNPRAPWAAAMPLGPIDPRERAGEPGSPIAPPYPEIAIASGRRSVAYLREVKRASAGRTFTVYLKDPRLIKLPFLESEAADLIWAPAHDRLRGANVMTTLTSPHRLHASVLAEARRRPDPRLAALPAPRIALLLGGDSKAYRFSDTTTARLCALLEDGFRAEPRPSVMATASRRTPPSLASAVEAQIRRLHGFFWEGTGDNPLVSMLALADHVIVTADSVNMVGEALATGKPVHIFTPDGGSRKTSWFLDELRGKGLVRDLVFPLEAWTYEPVNATAEIALEIQRRFLAHGTRSSTS
ncbi:MAG: mitochondrial fission ELM1 family protein [Beijerinckiaceae bacterium]|nr:mitochondrial fission ELM1 family protein [Beijerinckiaceae bacterium]